VRGAGAERRRARGALARSAHTAVTLAFLYAPSVVLVRFSFTRDSFGVSFEHLCSLSSGLDRLLSSVTRPPHTTQP